MQPVYYLAAISSIAFLLMGCDKQLAKAHRWRIPEAVLFLSALLGGSLGILIGMYLFRHKTRTTAFRVGIPLLILLQAVACGLYRWLP